VKVSLVADIEDIIIVVADRVRGCLADRLRRDRAVGVDPTVFTHAKNSAVGSLLSMRPALFCPLRHSTLVRFCIHAHHPQEAHGKKVENLDRHAVVAVSPIGAPNARPDTPAPRLSAGAAPRAALATMQDTPAPRLSAGAAPRAALSAGAAPRAALATMQDTPAPRLSAGATPRPVLSAAAARPRNCAVRCTRFRKEYAGFFLWFRGHEYAGFLFRVYSRRFGILFPYEHGPETSMRGFFLGFRVTIRNFVSIRTRSGNEYAGFLFRVPRDDSEFYFHTNTVRKRVCGFIFSDFGVYSRRSRFAGTLVL
jgi:hypothetical protein